MADIKPSKYPEALDIAIDYFGHLPGIGKRTAERLGLALMSWKPEDVHAFGNVLSELRDKVTACPVCGNFAAAGQRCDICTSSARRQDLICVVEQVTQILTIEKSGCFDGLYHVLGGKLSPLSGNRKNLFCFLIPYAGKEPAASVRWLPG